jgi:glycosyltransferase involved in cell wall biosynthesis
MARLRRAKLVYEAHELFSVSAPRGSGGRVSAMQRLERSSERLFAPKADLRLTASRRYGSQMASALGIDPPLAIPNYPVLPPAPQRLSPLRQRIGAAEDEIVILYQGGYYSGTRAIDVLIRAVALLPAQYRLVLLGFGSDQEEALLHDLIEGLHLSTRVMMLPAVSHRELPEYTAGADIGVIPFRLRTMDMQLCSPNKLYEYMAASIPVLASAADELKEVLTETGAGLTYDYDDPADLAKQVLALGPDRGSLRHIGAKGRRAAETRYCWQSAEHLLVNAYSALTST